MENLENADRIQQNNVNFEMSILSSIIFNPQSLDDISEQLKPHHLYSLSHQKIYEVILNLKNNDKPIDESFIDNELKGSYRAEMMNILMANPISNAIPYIVSVVEFYNKREVRKMLLQALGAIDAGDASADDVVTDLFDVYERIDKPEQTRAKSYDQIKDYVLSLPPEPIYPTGISFLDEALKDDDGHKDENGKHISGGFETGQLVLISGDPEAGKTMLGMQALKNVTEKDKALLFAFEFTTKAMVKTQIKTEGKDYSNKNLMVIDEGYDIQDILKELRYWRKQGVRYVMIDSQMRIENAFTKGTTMEERESEKFSLLAKFAHRNDMIIILIIQTSKSDAAASVISPMGSKKGAHEASIILHIKRLKDDEANGKKEMRELIMSKNKQNGVHFKGEIAFNPYTLKFTRPYSSSNTVEYQGHKPKGNIPVEHKDVNGVKTGSSSMPRMDEMMDMGDEQSDLFEMPVL